MKVRQSRSNRISSIYQSISFVLKSILHLKVLTFIPPTNFSRLDSLLKWFTNSLKSKSTSSLRPTSHPSPGSYKSVTRSFYFHCFNYYPTLNFTFIYAMKVILILSLFSLCFVIGSCKLSTVSLIQPFHTFFQSYSIHNNRVSTVRIRRRGTSFEM